MFSALLYTVLCAFLCYRIASKKGYDRVVAGILGALFGLLAVIGYLVVDPVHKE